MAEIITRDSEEFKELTGWIRRCGKALENATARIRPGIADEHYLTGEEVCEKLHVSRRTLQALRDEKVSYAYRELMNTEKTVSQVALDNGFASSRAFSREFQKKYNRLPSEVRQKFNTTPKEKMSKKSYR